MLCLKLLLKVKYPHGFYDFDYDEHKGTFLPKGQSIDSKKDVSLPRFNSQTKIGPAEAIPSPVELTTE